MHVSARSLVTDWAQKMRTVSPERASFPALADGLVYLDSAATTLKPVCVADAVASAYRYGTGGVHRGVFELAAKATIRFEEARAKLAAFVGAHPNEIVLGRGTTEALNVVARGLGELRLGPDDEILVSELCHHASLVAWQLAARRASAKVVVAPVDSEGTLHNDALATRFSERTRVVALPHVSNVTGAVLDVAAVAEMARSRGVLFLLDGAQAFPHLDLDMSSLGCDAYAFGAHKAYGPNGVGVLWARHALLEELPPLHGGGHMVSEVTSEGPTLAQVPARHEAGSPNVEGVLGFSAALDFLSTARAHGAQAREAALVDELTQRLALLPFVRILGRPTSRVALVSFVVEGAHAHDVASLLDGDGVAVRGGRMCAHPFFSRVGVSEALRASLGVYSESADIAALVAALHHAHETLA